MIFERTVIYSLYKPRILSTSDGYSPISISPSKEPVIGNLGLSEGFLSSLGKLMLASPWSRSLAKRPGSQRSAVPRPPVPPYASLSKPMEEL